MMDEKDKEVKNQTSKANGEVVSKEKKDRNYGSMEISLKKNK